MRRPGRRRRLALPAGVRPELARHEQVLAGAQEDEAGAWVLGTTFRLVVVEEDGQVQLDRPWHEVESGAWDPETDALRISWVDGAPSLQWQLATRTGPGRLPEVLRERVQASVVLVHEVDLGTRRTARVTIRSVLSSRELVEQVVPGPGARSDDDGLAAAIEETRADLRDQAGMTPGH